MKSVALIHTVKPVANNFAQTLAEYLDEPVKIHNLWDDFLANNPDEVGEFTIENRCRLFNDIKSAEMTGADVIVTTCSTLTPTVNMIRPFVKVPLIAIDDAMGRKAVTYGEKILILATAHSTLEPTRTKLMEEAAKIGKKITTDCRDNAKAYAVMRAGDMKTHDELVLEMAKEIKGYDCVVLAQASMTHLEAGVQEICKIPTLSTPPLCMQEIKETLEKI